MLHDCEFVAAQAAHRGAVPRALAQSLRHGPQQAVAGGVSQCVVDRLKPVEVQVEHGHAIPLSCRGERLIQPLAEKDAVRQSGQCIVSSHKCDSRLMFLSSGNIPGGAPITLKLSILVEHGNTVRFDPHKPSIRMWHGTDKVTKRPSCLKILEMRGEMRVRCIACVRDLGDCLPQK